MDLNICIYKSYSNFSFRSHALKEPESFTNTGDAQEQCNKDVEGLVTMNAFSRGHLFYVSSGGFIKYWAPLYNSESPTQVAVTTIKYCALTAKKHRDKLDNMYLFYDNMVFDYLDYIQRIFFNFFWQYFPCTYWRQNLQE